MERDEIIAINEKTDLRLLVEAAGTELKYVGGEYRGACPLHGGKDKSAFVVYNSPKGWRWTCFSQCAASGDAIEFVKRSKNISFMEAVNSLNGGTTRLTPEEIEQIAREREQRTAEELALKQREWETARADLVAAELHRKWHDALDDASRELWRVRYGIPDEWQDMMQLGYAKDVCIPTHGQNWHTPAMTFPVFGYAWELNNVRMRLMSPPTENDKYRPAHVGLPQKAYLCNPDLRDPSITVFVEGEMKALYYYIALDMPKAQVVGFAGKSNWRAALEYKTDAPHIWIFDPDGSDKAMQAAHYSGGRYYNPPGKIDDYMRKYGLDKSFARSVLQQARVA